MTIRQMFKIRNLLNLFRDDRKGIDKDNHYNIVENIPKLVIIEELNIDSVIGKKIIDLHFRYELLGWIDYFETFLTLETGQIITLPVQNLDRVSVINLPPKTGKFTKDTEIKIIGQKITNFHSEFEGDEMLTEYSKFIELENGFYIRELNMNPQGTGLATLYLLTEQEFKNITKD